MASKGWHQVSAEDDCRQGAMDIWLGSGMDCPKTAHGVRTQSHQERFNALLSHTNRTWHLFRRDLGIHWRNDPQRRPPRGPSSAAVQASPTSEPADTATESAKEAKLDRFLEHSAVRLISQFRFVNFCWASLNFWAMGRSSSPRRL